MTIQRYLGTASIVATLAFGYTGSVFAADVSFDTTGPNSDQQVVIDNTSQVTVHNTNNVTVSNTNSQQATTGNVNANKNTSVEGGLGSGNATNTNGTDTAVVVSNETVPSVPGGGGNGGGTGGNGGAGGSGGAGGGSVQGAATVGGFGGGEAVLPEVGATIPMDVSALRAAWHPQTNAAAANLAKNSRMFTAAMLITATVLSLLGAIGSVFYARRRQEGV